MSEPASSQASQADYGDLFVEYMAGGLQMSLTRIQAESRLLTDADRQQAWHTLSYALDIDRLWPLSCALLLALAPKLEQAGYREEWLVFLTTGIERARAYGDRPSLAELAYHAGLIERYLSRYGQAHAHLSESAALSAQLGHYARQGRTLNQLAYVEYERAHYRVAEELAQRALALPQLPQLEHAMAQGILGLTANEDGRYEDAITHHRHALEIRRQAGDRRTMAWSLQNIGYAYRRQGQADEAILYLNEAAEILSALNDTYHHAIVLLNLGSSYIEAGQPDEAIEPLLRARQVFIQLGATRMLANTYVSLGNEYSDLGDIDSAIQHYRLAVEHFGQIASLGDQLNAQFGLANALLEKGENNAAEENLLAIEARLPSIANNPFHYNYLSIRVPSQLERVRQASLQGPT
jgi:tetratricopeptide (TPR) repeat protein